MGSLHLDITEYTVHVYHDVFNTVKPICDLVVRKKNISCVEFGQAGFHLNKSKFNMTQWFNIRRLKGARPTNIMIDDRQN